MKITELQPLNSQSVLNPESSSLPNLPSDFESKKRGTYEQLNQLFTEQDQQEKTVQEARDILGESAKDLSDSEVYNMVNEVQFLVDTWIEEFERKTFDGKTLNELLGLNP